MWSRTHQHLEAEAETALSPGVMRSGAKGDPIEHTPWGNES